MLFLPFYYYIICGVDKAVIRALIERVVPKLFSLDTITLGTIGDAMSQLKFKVLGNLLLYQHSFIEKHSEFALTILLENKPVIYFWLLSF